MIPIEIVQSAREFGKWLNLVAYFVAKEEVKKTTSNYWEEIRKVKGKVLIELESAAFSAKTGEALIGQTVTRAGRLSGMDAPEAAALFMEKAMEGKELNTDQAKNLVLAFSRLKNKTQKKEEPQNNNIDEQENEHTKEDIQNSQA